MRPGSGRPSRGVPLRSQPGRHRAGPGSGKSTLLHRRDARLASLRLLGATPREVVGLTVVETALHGLAGAVGGTVLYGALLPVWAQVSFQDAPPTVGELWVGVPALAATWAAVPVVVAVVSGFVSLRRVVVSPLGVAQRVQRPRLRAARLVLALVGLGVFMVLSAVRGALGAALVPFLLGGLLLASATMNAVGPWLIGMIGRRQLRRARTPAQLLAARRLLGDPRPSCWPRGGCWGTPGRCGASSAGWGWRRSSPAASPSCPRWSAATCGRRTSC